MATRGGDPCDQSAQALLRHLESSIPLTAGLLDLLSPVRSVSSRAAITTATPARVLFSVSGTTIADWWRRSVRAGELKRGRHGVSVMFQGTNTVAPSKAKRVRLIVTKK